MDVTKKISHFKLLTATPSFAEWIRPSGSRSSPLQARLVYSWLVYRSRLGLGASAREISRHTGLHPTTVAEAVGALSGLIDRQGGNWLAVEPPAGLFRQFAPDNPKHWSDHYTYLTVYIPKKGAKVEYPETSRRFGLHHGLIWSFLFRKAKDGVVRRFTVAGAATMFGLDEKTIKAVLDDLLWLRMIDREDLGRSSDITVLPLTEDHLALFQPKPETERKRVEPTEKKPRTTSAPYKYRGDQWDASRRFCDGLMPQKKAEEAISKAQQLGDTADDFETLFRRAKEWHDKNILSGKVAKGNFGKYLNVCQDRRLKKLDEANKEAARLQQLETYYSSPEYEKQRAEDEKQAAADPLHRLFTPSPEAVLARVQFDPEPLKNIRAWDKCSNALSKNIMAFVRGKSLDIQKQIDLQGNLRHNILKHALSALNCYYRQPTLASSGDFLAQINVAIAKVAPEIQLLETVAPVVDNAPSKNS